MRKGFGLMKHPFDKNVFCCISQDFSISINFGTLIITPLSVATVWNTL